MKSLFAALMIAGLPLFAQAENATCGVSVNGRHLFHEYPVGQSWAMLVDLEGKEYASDFAATVFNLLNIKAVDGYLAVFNLRTNGEYYEMALIKVTPDGNGGSRIIDVGTAAAYSYVLPVTLGVRANQERVLYAACMAAPAKKR